MSDEVRPGTLERQWIDNYFNDLPFGRFLEIGSYDGVTDSLTNGLIQKGWGGVMVEANPHIFDRLLQNHGDNTQILLVHAAVSNYQGLATLFDGEGDAQTSTISPRFYADNAGKFRYRRYTVPTINPEQLAQYFGGWWTFDLVVVDAEGMSESILWSMDDLHRVKVVCVEYHTTMDIVVTRMRETHDVAAHIPPNVIFTRKK